MNTRTFSQFGNAGRASRAFLAFLAIFLLFGSWQRVAAQVNSSITGSSIIIDTGKGNRTFDGKSQTDSTDFEGANLGTFDVSDFGTILLLNGGSLFTTEAAPDVINGGVLSYEVANSAGVSFGVKTVTLPLANSTGGNKTFFTSSANANLLASNTSGELLAPGTYTVDVFFTANGRNSTLNRNFSKRDPNDFSYQARFTVTGVRPSEPPTSTTWTGGKNDNWFDAANWTNGVPTPTKDATIPDFGSGSTVQYPNIYSNAIKPNSTSTTRVQNPDGTFRDVVTPVIGYDNTGSGPAQTRDFIMQGSSQAQRSIARLIVGRLEVYRNFSNLQDSFIQRENTTISFAGTDQEISGSASGFVNVEINGGGIKTLVRNFAVQAGGTLEFKSGILSTNINDVNTSFVELFPSTIAAGSFVPSGRIIGETDATYLRGFVKTSQVTGLNTPQAFGNIGLTLTFFGNDPGIVTVTRNTAENYASINNGSNARPSIRRIFGVRPTDQQTNSGGLNATMVFRYLDGETRNLEPNAQSLNESNLALFLSATSGNVFGQLGREAINTTTNELTKTNVRTFATFTLSEATEPLPVTLIAFDAKRVNQDAILTWETAAELNNKGFEVQVSTDGRTFRTLAFVSSASPNSDRLRSYRYEDKEAGKVGLRYYRLRQLDLNGKETYYGPRALSFGGKATEGEAIAAYPNPFDSELAVSMQTVEMGNATVTVSDMTGRVVSQQRVTLSRGANSFTLDGARSLKQGVYFVRVVTATGKEQVVRVSKR